MNQLFASGSLNNCLGQLPSMLSRLSLLAATLTAIAVLPACTAVGSVADKVDTSLQQRDYDKQKGRLIRYMNDLRAKGDPLGDYYYALGNSDGWLHDVKDPAAITQLFRDAAAKGSMDAKILLARQKAFESDKPGDLDYALVPKDVDSWNAALADLKPLLEQQCYVRRLTLDMGIPKVTSYSIADDVWPKLRDGKHRQDAKGNWEQYIKPDAKQAAMWKAIDDGCALPASPWIP